MALCSWAFRSLIILDSSFIIRNSWDSVERQESNFCDTFEKKSSFIIHHHSSLSIDDCSCGRHHLWFISFRIQWRSHEKSKIIPSWNGAKISPKSKQNRSWNPPGTVLEASKASWRGPRPLEEWTADFCSHSRTKWPFWRKMVISFESESKSKSKPENWKSNLSQKLDGYWLARASGRGARTSSGLQLGSQGGPKIALEATPERFKNASESDHVQKSVFEGCP